MIVSSFDPPLQEFFDGYAFSGADFIAGASGFADFRKAGGSLNAGLDGCYTVLRRDGLNWEAGTDARGLRKLYLYRSRDAWAVGSSLNKLAAHLRERGVSLKPNLAVLRALGVRQALTSQLNSTHTIFQDVSLVPSFCVVQIGTQGPIIQSPKRSLAEADYEEALGQFLHVWRSRLATLVADDRTTFSIDLSGGLDSRAVFAFAYSSGLLQDTRLRTHVASQERMPEDFTAASEIARRLRLELNGPSMPMRTATDPRFAIDGWQNHSLGVYLPIYLNPHRFDALSVRCHGAGGGTFRDIFTDTSLRERLLAIRKHFTPGTFDEYMSTVLSDLDALRQLRPEVDAQKLHYREFRNRFHFGHTPQTRTTYSPLNSILVDRIADNASADHRRLYFDIMDSLVPNLKNAPYDNPAKSPADTQASWTSARMAHMQPTAGRVFASNEVGAVGAGHQREAFSILYDLAGSALKDSRVIDAIGDNRIVSRAQKSLLAIRSTKSRPRANAIVHQDASYLLAVALAVGSPLGA